MDHDPINDKNIKKALLNPESMEILEEKIADYSTKLRQLQQKELTFEKKIKKKDLESVIEPIKNSVEAYLETTANTPAETRYVNFFDELRKPLSKVQTCTLATLLAAGNLCMSIVHYPIPAINNIPLFESLAGLSLPIFYLGYKFGNSIEGTYTFDKKLIKLSKKYRENTILTFSHEYTHHLQYCKELDFLNTRRFTEGQATIVEKHIAEQYTEKEDEESFMLSNTDNILHDLQATYLWISDQLEIPTKKSLINNGLGIYENGELNMYTQIYFSQKLECYPHPLGTSFILVLEEKYGPKAHVDLLHRRDTPANSWLLEP